MERRVKLLWLNVAIVSLIKRVRLQAGRAGEAVKIRISEGANR